jgi:hypothetical protein
MPARRPSELVMWQWGLAAATVVLGLSAAYVMRQTFALRAELQGAAPTVPTVPIVELTLTPGLLRDASIPVVALPKDTLLARVTIVLAAPGAPQYTIRLLSSTGAERWRETGVGPVRIGMRAAVTVDLPVRVLTGGEFILEVSSGGGSERPEDYRFRAISR